jgi:hypothetical protein
VLSEVANNRGGPTSRGFDLINCVITVFPYLINRSYGRALILGTYFFPSPGDLSSLKWHLAIMFIKLVGGDAYQEFNGPGIVVASQDANHI